MNKVLLVSSLCIFASASAMAHFNKPTSQNSSKWDIGGKIAERCTVSTYDGGPRSTSLDLASNNAQDTASVSLWCNTHNAKAKTTYSSKNKGQMINRTGDKISYTIDVDQAKGLSLASKQTIDQITGQGNAVGVQTRTVKVTPNVSGTEFAGIYRDTITVEVAAN